MDTVTVTAKQNHFGNNGMVKVGQTYDTTPRHAAELKRNGLVDYDGPAAEAPQGQKITVSDKPRPEKVEASKTGKEKVVKNPAKEKAEVKK